MHGQQNIKTCFTIFVLRQVKSYNVVDVYRLLGETCLSKSSGQKDDDSKFLYNVNLYPPNCTA